MGKLKCPWKCVGNEVLEIILPIENGEFFQPAMTETPYIFEQKTSRHARFMCSTASWRCFGVSGLESGWVEGDIGWIGVLFLLFFFPR